MKGKNKLRKINGQLYVELWDLDDEFNEVKLRDDIVPDLRRYEGYTPPHCDIAISESLGSTQNTARVTLYNPPIAFDMLEKPMPIIRDFREVRKRLKIWQFWPTIDGLEEPPHAPIFIGDLEPDTQVSSSMDITLTLAAKTNSFALKFGRKRTKALKWRETEGATYRNVVEDIFGEVVDQFKLLGSHIEDPDAKLDKPVKRIYQPQKTHLRY